MSHSEIKAAVLRLFNKAQLSRVYVDTNLNAEDQKPITLRNHIEHESENWVLRDYSQDTGIRSPSHTEDLTDYIDENLMRLEDGKRYLVCYGHDDYKDAVEATFIEKYGVFSHIAGSIDLKYIIYIKPL